MFGRMLRNDVAVGPTGQHQAGHLRLKSEVPESISMHYIPRQISGISMVFQVFPENLGGCWSLVDFFVLFFV